MKTVALVNHKGGVGKSTIAIHLANHFSRKFKTVLVDSDENNSSTLWAGRGDFTFDCLTLDEGDSLLLSKAKIMVIDTKARESDNELEHLANCDLIIVPTVPDIVSLEPSAKVCNEFPNNARLLINLAPPFPSQEGEFARDELKSLGFDVFNSVIRRSTAFPKAAIAGKTVELMGKRFKRVADSLVPFYAEVEEALNVN